MAQKLHQELQVRFDRLVAAMHGKDVDEQDARVRGFHGPQIDVRSEDVRIFVDDFTTILQEIKSSLGKR